MTMPTNNGLMADKTKKIKAYKELLKMSSYFRMVGGQNRKDSLNQTLFLFGKEGAPVRVYDFQELLEPQQRITRLLIEAGANPNYTADWAGRGIRCVRDVYSAITSYQYEEYDDGYSWYGQKESVFELFARRGKPHCALEVAKSDRFVRPIHLDEIFDRLAEDLRRFVPFANSWEFPEDFKLRKQLNLYQKALVYALFKKGMCPTNSRIYSELHHIVDQEGLKTRRFQNAKKQALNKKQLGLSR